MGQTDGSMQGLSHIRLFYFDDFFATFEYAVCRRPGGNHRRQLVSRQQDTSG